MLSVPQEQGKIYFFMLRVKLFFNYHLLSQHTTDPKHAARFFGREGSWVELTFAKTSGIVIWKSKKKWPTADMCVPINNPRNNCATHFGSSLLDFKVANEVNF